MVRVVADPLSSVEPSTGGLPYQQIQSSPADFGAAVGQATQGLGQAGMQAVDTGLEIATQQAAIHNQTVANDAYNQYLQKLNTIQYGDPSDPNSKGYMALQGRDALDAYPGVVDAMDKARTQILNTLQNPIQQRVFDNDSRRLMTYTMGQFGQHRAQQQKVWADQTSDALAQTNGQAAIASGAAGDDAGFYAHLQDGVNQIIEKGTRNGLSPEVIQQQQADFKSHIFAQRFDAIAEQNPMRAWQLYQQNQGALSGTDQLALEHRLKPQVMAWQSRQDADRIMGASGQPSALGPAAPAVAASAQRQGVGASLALTVASIESQGGAAADRPGGPDAPHGVFQMTGDTWRARGGTDANRADPQAQVDLGVANLAHSQDVARQALGAQPADWQTYVVHQQGDSGGPALLKADPNENAVDVLAQAYAGNRAKAQSAVVGNGG
ncbi:MAG: hypothetical protein JO157_01610, partial [Acetobacteraceae bacterium]|nr:hypothetical protein [Acetobacteraceae bacterium]